MSSRMGFSEVYHRKGKGKEASCCIVEEGGRAHFFFFHTFAVCRGVTRGQRIRKLHRSTGRYSNWILSANSECG